MLKDWDISPREHLTCSDSYQGRVGHDQLTTSTVVSCPRPDFPHGTRPQSLSHTSASTLAIQHQATNPLSLSFLA